MRVFFVCFFFSFDKGLESVDIFLTLITKIFTHIQFKLSCGKEIIFLIVFKRLDKCL